jgi:DNA relaxase NicK
MTPQKTTVDWLRFRAQAEPRDILAALAPMYGDHSEQVNFNFLERGILGFQSAAQIRVATMVVGRMDYGGDSQRGWVRTELNGTGCEWIQDWDAVSAVEDLPSSEIRRTDIALTTWKGEIDHETVVNAHSRGRFITAGRPPALRQITSSDPRAGRTCYIGKREQTDKFMRCYEKGFELVNKLGGRLPGEVQEIDGARVEDIYRCEVELKASSKDIPWDVLRRRDQYFAGSYPFCADILPGVEADILMRRPEREPQINLAAALENCRVQFGPTLYTALRAYHGDMTAVWDKIIGDHHSSTLEAAGVLLVDHE